MHNENAAHYYGIFGDDRSERWQEIKTKNFTGAAGKNAKSPKIQRIEKGELTQDVLKKLLFYDPETGLFKRRVHTSNRIKVGEVAGSPTKRGYIAIYLMGKLYKAHRLAWLYSYGVWPPSWIDHINRITHDNRLQNLRLSTPKQNSQNRIKSNRVSLSGILGSSRSGKKFTARISFNGKSQYLGTFDSAELAHSAYMRAKHENHPFYVP